MGKATFSTACWTLVLLWGDTFRKRGRDLPIAFYSHESEILSFLCYIPQGRQHLFPFCFSLGVLSPRGIRGQAHYIFDLLFLPKKRAGSAAGGERFWTGFFPLAKGKGKGKAMANWRNIVFFISVGGNLGLFFFLSSSLTLLPCFLLSRHKGKRHCIDRHLFLFFSHFLYLRGGLGQLSGPFHPHPVYSLLFVSSGQPV